MMFTLSMQYLWSRCSLVRALQKQAEAQYLGVMGLTFQVT